LPVGLLFLLVEEDRYLFGNTVEALIAAYYLLLVLSIRKLRTAALIGAVCLCLFSRYSLVLWIPLLLGVLWIRGDRKKAGLLLGGMALAFLIIYWLPFLRHDAAIFAKGYAYHSSAAVEEWKHTYGGAWPVHLYNGLGMAPWGYKFLPYTDVAAKLRAWQAVHLAASAGTVALLAVFYWRGRKRIPAGVFLAAALKVYLTVFYGFIQIPYKYLFLTPLMVSAGLLIIVCLPRSRQQV
jgi:hypothetical protein